MPIICLGAVWTKAFIAALISLTLSATAISPALAKDKSSAEKAKQRGVAEIHICTKRLGTVAIVEPDNQWWTALNLGSHEAIIKLFVMQSGCFVIVDSGQGMPRRTLERALADSAVQQELGRAAWRDR